MICDWCDCDFEEKDLHESYDVPCYLFEGNRKGRKNQADKFGRHWLCEYCHKKYEMSLMLFLRKKAKEFSNDYFQSKEEMKLEKDGDTKPTIN